MTAKMLKGLLLTCMVVALFSFDVPKGWLKAGSDPDKYNMGMEFGMGRTTPYAATIQSKDYSIMGFGTLMQNISPDKYRGRKIRMTGYMKSNRVNGWAGFWLRVDQEDSERPLAFDNMGRRAVRGTTEWTKYEIVLDVPENASNIAFGALLSGTGKIWFDDITLEDAGKAAPTAAPKPKKNRKSNEAPMNLGFEMN
jgi:hypothetical protein